MIAGFEVIRRNDGRGAWTDTVLRVKLVNRANYVEMAAKLHGLSQDRLEVTDGRGLEDRIAAARARLAQLRLQRAIEATQGVLTSAEQADAPR